jgi:sugar phosphate isomerase/epimerase
MKRVFSFSLGNIWRWDTSANRNVLIDFIRDLDVSGVELTFSTKEELYSFSLSCNNEHWLKNLDYVTIHAPFGLFEKSEDEKEVVKQITDISRLYDNIHAKNVIVHPENDLVNSELFKNCKFDVSTENLPRKNGVSIPDLKKILNKHPRMRLCLDVSHAYTWSKFETDKLVKAFKGRISQIHFSGTYRKKEHKSLRDVTKEFLLSIQSIKKLEVPIVIEEDMEIRSLEYVKEELEYVRNLFD